MKKILKWIFILLFVMIILIVAIVILINKRAVNNKGQIANVEKYEELAQKQLEIHTETSLNRFYAIKNCVEQFYEYYQYLNPENLDIKSNNEEIQLNNLKKWYGEKLYSILDKEYINYKGITLENISEKLGNIGKTQVLVDKVSTKDLENSSYICFVEGRTKEQNANIKNFKMAIRLSGTNNFKIFLEDYLNEKGYNNFSKDIDATELCKFEITDEKYNTYNIQAISPEEYVKELFSHYKKSVLNDQKYAYKLIDETYKNIRFENEEEYIKYVKENRSKIALSKIESYTQSLIDGITQYQCKDNNGNYYIFKETAPFQYTIVLDNYAIPTEEFKKEYSKKSETEKVIINIKKFFMGIDDKNYGYSYSVLSESFKNNKYPTKNDFISYVKQNFFEENNIEYISYEKQNGVYIYKIKLTDATENSTQQKEFNVILKINSGTDFEMSIGSN